MPTIGAQPKCKRKRIAANGNSRDNAPVADLASIQRKTHKAAWIVGAICFVIIVASGVLTDLFHQSAAQKQRQSPILGRLHVKYEANKETPYVDVFDDRDTLAAWRLIFVSPPASQTESDLISGYRKLVATGKLTSVDPNTLVRVIHREQPTDCQVTILSGKHREHSGWVDCDWITD